MIKQNIKYVLWILLFFLAFILFNAWKNEKQSISTLDLSYDKSYIDKSRSERFITDATFKDLDSDDKNIFIKTNLVDAKISSTTGDLVYLSLKKYSKELNGLAGITIFDKSDERFYYVQSGILNKQFLENTFAKNLSLSNVSYNVNEDDSNCVIILKYEIDSNIFVYKVYTFRTYSYEISIDFYIQNNSDIDFFAKHYGLIRYKNNSVNDSIFSSGMKAYEGGAVYTENKPYKKLSFDDLNNKSFSYSVNGGWIAFLERYFISAWIPDVFNEYVYIAEKTFNDFYSYKYLNSNDVKVIPKACVCFNTTLFVGPKTNVFLNNLSKGLELTIDYGIFWPIASPIFFLLTYIFSFLNNWGFSIVVVTLIIKLLFFNLSSISYKSIGNMKKLQPRLELLKEQYKDDKREFGNAVMNLYKKEKVNPLGGCLPVLIQIPVFISLYYVLLESIELRHAPFIYWITDLSNKDMYYILPVIMSITMFIQQKLNPPIQDPLQAKVMMFLPVVFLFIFLQFPAGLILYWIVNNLLSILQQWVIIKRTS